MDPELEAIRRTIAGLSGREKAALAQKLGVTVRTVQRWAISPGSGKQARSFIPKKVAAKPTTAWPLGYKQRANTATVIEKGMSRSMAGSFDRRTFTEKFSNIRDALRYAKALATGDVDRWLRAGWERVKLEVGKNGVNVIVTYVGGGGRYGPGELVGSGEPLPPEGLLDTPGTSDPFGDVLLSDYR